MSTEAPDLALYRRDLYEQTPIAHARRVDVAPITGAELEPMSLPFAERSVGQRFLGPGWVNAEGVACVVFIAPNNRQIKALRGCTRCGVLAWRWDNSPSTYFSLTVILPNGTERPHIRWMRPSEDPVVLAIRREGRFFMTVVNSRAEHSGWFDALFHDSVDGETRPSKMALESLWSFRTPGLPYSKQGARFDPFARKRPDGEEADEIPLWAESVSDFWKTLSYEGPWEEDLSHLDRATAAWGKEAWRFRHRAAGCIQVLIDRLTVDRRDPAFDEQGKLLVTLSRQDRAHSLVSKHPQFARWLAAVGGPRPDAKGAHEAMLAILNDPEAAFVMVAELFGVLSEMDDEDLQGALHATFEAALRDVSTTRCGRQRPWLANTAGPGLTLNAAPIDLDAPLADIQSLWISGLELMDLIDMGFRVTPSDFPAPFDQLCKDLSNVAIEGKVDDTEARIQALLEEAQEARQWSIPWGARVEVRFGPFVAMRIFEKESEFSCHFLDAQERYFHLAIGLKAPPRAVIHHLVRLRQDDGEPVWNVDAELSLRLIATAIIRDFLVVENRERVFGARKLRSQVRGRNLRTIIYLPRVRYSTAHPERWLLATELSGERTRHSVTHHLRRSTNASAAQHFLAQRYGIHVPQGFTFVRPHERGSAAAEARIRVYRSRSASEMIFDAVASAPSGTRPRWFDFEKDCARFLRARNLTVIHRAATRDGDGGVDLFATAPNGQSWVVQCKCWAPHRPVGPEVVRELEGAIRLADHGAPATSRGMIITTSTLTDGARAAATALDFEIIEGADLAKDL